MSVAAVYCNVWQSVAVRFDVLQNVAICGSSSQCVSVVVVNCAASSVGACWSPMCLSVA